MKDFDLMDTVAGILVLLAYLSIPMLVIYHIIRILLG